MSQCPTCFEYRCCNEDILSYALTSGSVYFNEQTSINFVCPPGFSCIPGVYTVPAGRIQMVVNTNGQPSTLRLQCCQSELVRDVPADATPEQIAATVQQMVNACAVQLANCDANRFVNRIYNSDEVESNPCANTGRLLGWIGEIQPPLPPVIAWSNGELRMGAGVFSSTVSESDATKKAQTFLDNFAIGLVFGNVWECGYWNTEQICPDTDPPEIIPAFSAFSNISQEQANQNALALCSSDCQWVDGSTSVDGFTTWEKTFNGPDFVISQNTTAYGCGINNVQLEMSLNFEHIGPERTITLNINIPTATVTSEGATGWYWAVYVDEVVQEDHLELFPPGGPGATGMFSYPVVLAATGVAQQIRVFLSNGSNSVLPETVCHLVYEGTIDNLPCVPNSGGTSGTGC